jgi:hypothetical protein
MRRIRPKPQTTGTLLTGLSMSPKRVRGFGVGPPIGRREERAMKAACERP